jgi:hypothetical protein
MTLAVTPGQELPAGTLSLADPERLLIVSDLPVEQAVIAAEAAETVDDAARLAHDIVDSFLRSTAAVRAARLRPRSAGGRIATAAAFADRAMRDAGWDRE